MATLEVLKQSRGGYIGDGVHSDTSARVIAFLETVDDPATAIPQLVAEMEE